MPYSLSNRKKSGYFVVSTFGGGDERTSQQNSVCESVQMEKHEVCVRSPHKRFVCIVLISSNQTHLSLNQIFIRQPPESIH